MKLRSARPKGYNVKCICFVATAAVVGMMLTHGLPVRAHPLHPDRYVVPSALVSDNQLNELIQRQDFIFLSTVVFLTGTPGSNATYTSDATWNNSSNTIETIAAGGGADCGTNGIACSGGGGGAWNKISNFSFASPGATTATYRVGAAGAGGIATSFGGAFAGTTGGDTWFNATTLAGSSVGSKGGGGGTHTSNKAAGGAGSSGVGTSSHDGGNSGDYSVGVGSSNSTGGGGAAGPNGNGNQGVDSTSTSLTTSAGGSGDAGFGGAGGHNSAGGTGVSGGSPYGDGQVGGAGAEYTSTAGPTGGSGGGGGGGFTYNGDHVGGDGGLYGGGGGALTVYNNVSVANGRSGNGAQGIIVLTWTPSGGGDTLLTQQLRFM